MVASSSTIFSSASTFNSSTTRRTSCRYSSAKVIGLLLSAVSRICRVQPSRQATRLRKNAYQLHAPRVLPPRATGPSVPINQRLLVRLQMREKKKRSTRNQYDAWWPLDFPSNMPGFCRSRIGHYWCPSGFHYEKQSSTQLFPTGKRQTLQAETRSADRNPRT